MKVTKEKLPDSQVGIEIEIPAESSKKVYENVIKKLTRSVNIPGFRRGKVPRKVVIQRLGETYVKATALEEIIDSSIKSAIQQEEIPFIGNLQLKSDMEGLVNQFEPGQPLIVSATMDVVPEAEYESESYKQLTVQAEEIIYDPEQVNEWLENQRSERAMLVPIEDRPAAMGDQLLADYQAYEANEDGSQGEAIEGVGGTDFDITMEEGRLVEGLVEGLVGANVDGKKVIPVTFPEDYPLESVAGKPVVFEINVKEIKEKELPELDDDFAEQISEFETLEELRNTLAKNFEERAKNQTEENINTAIKDALADNSSSSLPNTLIDQESERLIQKTFSELGQMGLNVEELLSAQDNSLVTSVKDNARGEAVDNLKTQIMINEIATKEDISPTEAELEERIQELQEAFKGQKVDPDRLANYVESTLTEEKVLKWLRDTITIELVPEGSLSKEEEEEDDASEASPDPATEEAIDVAATEV